MSVSVGLARKTVGGGGLWVFAVGASAPMTVLVGGITNTYRNTGVVGVPLSFLLVGAALGVLVVGYGAVSRYVQHPAPFYAVLAHGLGRPVGVGGAVVAVAGYAAIGIGLYGLLGATMSRITASVWQRLGHTGFAGGPWWVWAAGGWVGVTVLGVLHVHASTRLLVATLAAEIAVIGLFDLAAFTHPASGHVSVAPLAPQHLFVNGVGGVLAFAIAAFIGVETAPVYAEEAREEQPRGLLGRRLTDRRERRRPGRWGVHSRVQGRPGMVLAGGRSVSVATSRAVLFCLVFYTVSAWAVALSAPVVAGMDPDVPIARLGARFGPLMTVAASLLLVNSIFGAMLAFHNAVARYLFALGRERVFPQIGLTRVGAGGQAGAPRGASLALSGFAAVVLVVVVAFGVDPVGGLFTWASTGGAVCILAVLVASAVAALRFFQHRSEIYESEWVRLHAPLLGVGSGLLVLGLIVVNLDAMLGLPARSRLPLIVPAAVGVVGLAGLWWGVLLRAWRPDVYAGIGRGVPDELDYLDPDFADLKF